MTDKYAVIGNPIEHSLSPEIHAIFAEQTKQDIQYGRLWAPIDGFVETVEKFFADGGRGLNVTAPFKQDAFAWVEEADPLAGKAKAVNTIAIEDDIPYGYNTDGIGLVEDLQCLKWDLSEQKVLILGAGGAVKGIVQSLLNAECELTVANRTFAKAQQLQQDFPQIQIAKLGDLQTGWDIVVNAITAWSDNFDLPVAKDVVARAKCYDLTYSRTGQTPFLSAVESVASSTADGLGMLIDQGAAAFQIWRGVLPDTNVARSNLRKKQT